MDRIRIATLTDLPDGRGVRLDVSGRRVALFRIGDEVHALGDRCSHAEASLAEGEVFEGAVDCPRHGSAFDLGTGEPGSFPAVKPIPVYPTEIADGEVFLFLDPAGEETP